LEQNFKINIMRLFYFTLFAVLLGFKNSALSQDVLIKTNGEKLEVIVTEITTYTIKYKLFNDPNGPLRIIAVKQVNEIIYEDGQFDTFNKRLENPVTQKSSARYAPRAIEGAGFGIDIMPGLASTTSFFYQFNPDKPTEPWRKELISNFSLSLRISNKFYFDVKKKWRTGIMFNWVRLGFTTGLSGPEPSGFLNISPLNIGTCNVIKLSEKTAIEANFGAGLMLSIGANESELASLNLNPEVKFRYKVFAVGLDYIHSQAFGNQNENRYNVISVVLGFKF